MALTLRNGGLMSWSSNRDDEGHREYKCKLRINSNTGHDGPANVRTFIELLFPVGTIWAFLDDVDLWAWRRPGDAITPEVDGEKNRYWAVELVFSTKPLDRCHDNPVEDPLLQPQIVSGRAIKFQEEAQEDRFGVPITNSAHEQIRGPQNEWDRNRSQIVVEQNVPVLEAELVDSMMDTLNDTELWGFQPRCVKLSDWSWQKRYFGQCETYYTRTLVFDTNTDTFDRDFLDEGTKALNGHWDENTGEWTLDNIAGAAPDPENPAHFIRVQDRNGNPMRVILNGEGVPIEVNPGTGTGGEPGVIHVERYDESDFLLLAIPTEL